MHSKNLSKLLGLDGTILSVHNCSVGAYTSVGAGKGKTI